MALTVGTNSWATVAQADAYLENNMGAEDWFALAPSGAKGSASKENVLVTAYTEIMSSPLVTVPVDSTDSGVISAQAEMALYLLNFRDEMYGRRASIATGLSEFTYSERKETFNSRDGGGSPTLPGNVLGLLIAYSSANTTVELLP